MSDDPDAESDDPELEALLRRFRPRPPRPLRRSSARTGHGWVSMSAAAVAATLALWAVVPKAAAPKTPRRAVARRAPLPTAGILGAALRAGTYEALLDEIDARALPDPRQAGGALRLVADVSEDLRRLRLQGRSR